MSKRFYLQNGYGTPFTVGFDASWNKSAGAATYYLSTARDNSGMATTAIAQLTLGPNLIALRQFISAPLDKDQTISGTIKGQVRAIENNSALNATIAVGIRVVSRDGSVVRGTLLGVTASDDTSATPPEMAVALTNRRFQDASENFSITLSSLDCKEGDRIVVEVGYRENNTTTNTTQTGGMSFGDDSATDLPENSTTTTANNPWIEFSQDITFKSWSNFKDDFRSLNTTTNWFDWSGGTISIVSGQLNILNNAADTNYHGLDSLDRYQLAGESIFCQVVNAGNQALASLEMYPFTYQQTPGYNTLFFVISGNTVFCIQKAAGVQTTVFSVAYNSAVHKWFRLRESGGTTYWDYSTNGTDWTNFFNEANPFTIDNGFVTISFGTFASEASPTTAIVDNFNCVPSGAFPTRARRNTLIRM